MNYVSNITAFYEKHKRMPSMRELAQICGYSSSNAASKLVDRLAQDGLLEKDDKGKLLPGRTMHEVKVLGLVEAGFPTHADETLIDTMSLDEYLIDNREASFILRVKGDSMIEAGIQEGDLVIVERGREPKVGDIVIAEVDNQYTMKYYNKRAGKPFLMPANKKYAPIYPEGELKIEAIVTSVVRKVKS